MPLPRYFHQDHPKQAAKTTKTLTNKSTGRETKAMRKPNHTVLSVPQKMKSPVVPFKEATERSSDDFESDSPKVRSNAPQNL